MFNGHQTNGASSYNCQSGAIGNDRSRASLTNLVNTCYLNSVLYTLRYTPDFLRKCHHLVTDLYQINTILYQTKHKSSSLGRNMPSMLTGGNSRSNSSKDLLSLGNSRNEISRPDFQIILDELHDLYISMHTLEVKDTQESCGPRNFRHAFVNKYKTFSGFQQQDAHEFLVCLLSSINDTCSFMAKKIKELQSYRENYIGYGCRMQPEKVISSKDTKSWIMPSWKKRKNVILGNKDSNGEVNTDVDSSAQPNQGNSTDSIDYSKLLLNTKLINDFEGISILRTRCLECETVTERKETFYDLCIPINDNSNYDQSIRAQQNIFKEATVTCEYLNGPNKYYCEECFRYNEARREVCYQKLPRILIFQLKRFMSSAKGTEKINYYIPTPMEIPCFCDECCQLEEGQNLHTYTLFSIIMHKGATMAEGHYVSFVRGLIHNLDYFNCVQDHILPNLSNNDKQSATNVIRKPHRFFKSNPPLDYENSGILSALNNSSNHSQNYSNSGAAAACRSVHCCSVKHTTEKGSESVWLECNDEIIRRFTSKEFEQQLQDHTKVPSTPYLLFYVKSNV